jgi:hypothetical protein
MVIFTLCTAIYFLLLPRGLFWLAGLNLVGLGLFVGYLYLIHIRLPRSFRQQVEAVIGEGDLERLRF